MIEPITTGIAIAGLASSAYGGMQAGKQGSKDRAQRDRMFREGMGLITEERARQRGLYGPIEEKMAAELSSDQPRNWGLIKGDIEQNFAEAGRKNREYLSNTGNLGEGVDASLTQGNALAESRAKSRAYQDALQKLRGDRYSFLQRYNPAGLVGMAVGQTNTMAASAQRDADQSRADEASGWAGFARGLSNLSTYMGSRPPEATVQNQMQPIVASRAIEPMTNQAPAQPMIVQPQQPAPQAPRSYGAQGLSGHKAWEWDPLAITEENY